MGLECADKNPQGNDAVEKGKRPHRKNKLHVWMFHLVESHGLHLMIIRKGKGKGKGDDG